MYPFWGSVCLNCIFRLSKDISVSFSRQFALFWICVFQISHGMDENWLIKLASFLPIPWRNSCYQVKLLSVTEIAFFSFLFFSAMLCIFFFPLFWILCDEFQVYFVLCLVLFSSFSHMYQMLKKLFRIPSVFYLRIIQR